MEQVKSSYDMNTNKLGGEEAPTAEGILGLKVGNTSSEGSKESYAFGTEVGEGVLTGGQLSVNKEGMHELIEAGKEAFKDVFAKPAFPVAGHGQGIVSAPERKQ